MKITFEKSTDKKPNPYRNRTTGKLGYVYVVSGTPEELAAYKKSKGFVDANNPGFYRENASGQPLWFEKESIGLTAELKLNAEGTKFYADTTEDDMFATFCKKGGVEYAKMKMAELKA